MKRFIYFLITAIMSLQAIIFVGCNTTPKIKEYSITATADAGSTISASSSKVKEGESVTFTFTIEEGYILEKFTINGGQVSVSDNSYVVTSVLADLTAKVQTIKADVTVNFTCEDLVIPSQNVVYGRTFGTLPVPKSVGNRFVCWVDEFGNPITATSIVDRGGIIELTARLEQIEESDKDFYVPFTMTSVYHDMAATKYGLAFHNKLEPIAPTVYVVEHSENENPDFSKAREVECTYAPWLGEFIVTAVIDELKFDTTYSVKFGDYCADVWGNVYTFKTRKEVIEKAEFIYVNDTQETYKLANKAESAKIGDIYWSQLMNNALAHFPKTQFIAHGGDITNYGNMTEYWQEMMDSIERYLFNLPVMGVAGNHADPDWYSSGYETFNRLFNVDAPSTNNIRGLYYSFDYGPLHFVALRSNDVFMSTNPGTLSKDQITWLKQDLEKANANENIKFTIAMMHEGPILPKYVEGNSNYHEMQLRPQLMPIFDEYGVDLLLCGHNHYNMYSHPLVYDETYDGEMCNGILREHVKILSKSYELVDYDGVQIYKYNFDENVTDHGTIYMEIGSSGDQYGKGFTADVDMTQYGIYRKLSANSANSLKDMQGNVNENALCMYSYIEVDAEKIVARTYGVDVKGMVTSNNAGNLNAYNEFSTYVDGFMIY